MENDHKLFQNAISNFTFDLACRGAIRHLCDLGYDAAAIRQRLDLPLPLAKITEELQLYRSEKDDAAGGAPQYEYIRETDAYGKTSFRRVPKK
ncbi:MAG: hypothetical protein IJ600_03080 [Lachnospiraceae bacterium]|nr:hypothetical protein [Lachnospiraceae bacterium]